MQIFPSLNCIMLIFLPRRNFVTETFCFGDVLLQETFCYGDVLYGDVLSRRRFVRRRLVCAPYILATRSIRTFPCRIFSPGLTPSDFFLCLKAKFRARSGFPVPGHLQIRFGESVEHHQQRRQFHRGPAMATAMTKVCRSPHLGTILGPG
jgi:hypothetical protein